MTFNWRPAVSGPGVASAIDDWRERAACRDEEPELFFPVGDAAPARAQAEEAKAICRRCPVITACALFARELDITDGVYGGQTAAERQADGKPCKAGHPQTVANVSQNGKGGFKCRLCANAYAAEYAAAKRADWAAEMAVSL